ncbi:hypothetical protein D3C80_912990 [compost metagenome]
MTGLNLAVSTYQAPKTHIYEWRQAARDNGKQIANFCQPIAPAKAHGHGLRRAQYDQQLEWVIGGSILLTTPHHYQKDEQQKRNDKGQRNENQKRSRNLMGDMLPIIDLYRDSERPES